MLQTKGVNDMKLTVEGVKRVLAGLCLFVMPGAAVGNNITVTNLSLVAAETAGTVDVQFTVAWDNSWRASWTEPASANVSGTDLNLEKWDAAWVFLKWRTDGDWKHATLSTNDYTAPEGTAITVFTGWPRRVHLSVGRRFGLFQHDRQTALEAGLRRRGRIRRRLRPCHRNGVRAGRRIRVGSGSDTETGSFTDGSWTSSTTIPFMIASEDALTITNAAGYLWGISSSGDSTIGGYGTLPAAFPKGFQAFYCMKYEISQGQYAEFLNMLTSDQAALRYSASNTGVNRYTIAELIRTMQPAPQTGPVIS
jgi:hypothetical protein